MQLTQYERNTYGNMKVNQRQFKGEKFPIWNAVQECENENCIASHVCTYYQYNPDPVFNRKCRVVLKYLQEVEIMVLSHFGKDFDDADLFRTGLHLIPLYKQLALLKIVEMGLTTRNMVETTKGGTTKMHAVFKEMRDCIRVIDQTWRELGMTKTMQPRSPEVPINANPSYYEQMEKDALKEQKSHNRIKLVKRNGTTR